jgi:phosphonate transport system substrate-binding protein
MMVWFGRTSRVCAILWCGWLAAAAPIAQAQPPADCKHRGNLDARFCDENQDLVADPPKDAARLRNPATLAFSYSPVEDPAIYENIFKPFTAYLARCTGKRVTYQRVQSNAAEIEAMRQGHLHVAGFATGPTTHAVNQAGAVPFAIKGNAQELLGYRLLLIVRKDSPFHTPTDLKGKRVAHVQPSSNSGNLAPRALFPGLGLTPDRDYKVLYSGKHDSSVAGVLSGEYDGAAVASGVYKRMAARGQIRDADLRIVWQSELFPTTSFAYAHDLEPKLRDTIVRCFYEYRYPAEMQKIFEGADRFVPITYQKDWAVVRKVAALSEEKAGMSGAQIPGKMQGAEKSTGK